MKILFCGDFVPGGVLHYQDRCVDSVLSDYIADFDLRICTLECAMGSKIPYDEVKMKSTNAIVYSNNEDFRHIKELGFNIVSLANNHITDLGKEGLGNTIKHLDQNGILHFGAGANIDEAKRPLVITLEGLRIAFIGCLFKGFAPTIFHVADIDKYGVYQTDIETIIEDIKSAKEKYDRVIIMPHWAQEYNYMPPIYCYDYAKRMIDAGADAIIGSHPHIVNPHLRYKGKDVYFSLGNFLFPDICMKVPRPMYYPCEYKEVLELPRVWAYPPKIDQPSVAVWNKSNRVGMVVELSFDGKNSRFVTNHNFVFLGVDNLLRQYNGLCSYLLRTRLTLFAFFIKLPQYRYIRKIYMSRWNILRRIKRKLQIILREKTYLKK